LTPLESNQPLELVPEASPGLAEPAQQESRRRALLIRLAFPALAISVLAPTALWIGYRTSFVVARQAIVRGHIADVGSLIDGLVVSVEVLEGDRVEAGQILAQLDNRRMRFRMEEAKSQLEKAKLSLEVEQMAISFDARRKGSAVQGALARIDAARAGLKSAESRAESAQATHNQHAKLSEEGALAGDELRDSKTKLSDALAQVSAAQAGLVAASASLSADQASYAGIAVSREHIRVAAAEMAQRQAEFEVAEAQLENTIIRAPKAGAVVRRIVEPGTSIRIGTPLVSLWTGRSLWVEAWVDEEDLDDIEVGGRATIDVNSFPGRKYAGRIRAMSVATDVELPDDAVPQPRHRRMRQDPVIAVRIEFDRPTPELFPGLSAEAAIKKTR